MPAEPTGTTYPLQFPRFCSAENRCFEEILGRARKDFARLTPKQREPEIYVFPVATIALDSDTCTTGSKAQSYLEMFDGLGVERLK
jgi:hypothetical protein